MKTFCFKIVLLLIFYFSFELIAQSVGSYYNPKDDQYRLLGLKRAKEVFDSADAEFKRQETLFNKQLISARQLEISRISFIDAEVNYHQALLALLFEQQYVSVQNAVKYQDANGRIHVKLTLANSSGGGGEFKKLINVDDELFRSLQPDVVNDVYVSLLNDDNAIISLPYEAKLEQIFYGKPVTINFLLLQDLDAITVNILYGSGTIRAPKIFLQKDISENKVVFKSDQFSQEVDLGRSATYRMTLELFSGLNNTYKLEVLNLPRQITHYFVDPQTQARLSQFKFTESSQTRNAGLQVFLPDRPTDQVKIEEPITFFVVAIPDDLLAQFRKTEDKIWTEKELKDLKIGYLKMELTPRGLGEILVKAPQLYFSILSSESINVPITVVNEGSRTLDNVEFKVDLPLNWIKEIAPNIINSLGIREEKIVNFSFTPPGDITSGKYEIRIRTTSLSDNQMVKAEDKTITIEIKPEANLFGTLFLVLFIIGLVAGIVIFGIKLMKK
jgi:NPCBM-associated, NEW3 domain of alpha-galactosidase